jgi:hypothetical protein
MRWLVVAALGFGCTTQADEPEIALPHGASCTGALGEILVPPPALAPQIVPVEAPVVMPGLAPRADVPQVQAPAPASVIVGIHVGSITQVAATEDDLAAVSVDSSGGLRLWPTLDGHREPIVLSAVGRTRWLSIQHAADELVIARLDDTGTLEILRRGVSGSPMARFAVASDRPLEKVQAIDSGALAVRDDGSLIEVNLVGETTGTILPDPGERIVALIYRNHRALALMQSQRGIVGRWIDSSPLRWGATTPRLANIDPAGAVLSADHNQLAASDPTHLKVTVFNLGTGKVLARPVDISADDQSGGFGGNRSDAVGFLDDGWLAVRLDGTLSWWHDSTEGLVDSSAGFVPMVVTGHHLVGTQGLQLTITSPYETRYLGYRTSNPTAFLPTPTGLLIGSRHSVMRVDHQFNVRVRYQLAPELTDFLPIDAHHVVATHSEGDVELVDLENPETPKQLAAGYGVVSYEPSSHLLAIDEAKYVQFVRFDPKSGTFDEATTLEVEDVEGQGSQTVELLDPVAANGNVALVVFNAFQFEGQQRSIRVTVVRSARAGVVPVTLHPRTLSNEEMVRFDNGDLSMLGISGSVRRKSPDGAYTAELGRGRLTLRRKSGETQWVLPANGVTKVAWSSNGELLAFGGGVGVMDVATGAFTERRCGWDFGLWSEPSDESNFGAELCNLR